MPIRYYSLIYRNEEGSYIFILAFSEISGPAHLLVGVDLNTGRIKMSWKAERLRMEPRQRLQRVALALSQGKV